MYGFLMIVLITTNVFAQIQVGDLISGGIVYYVEEIEGGCKYAIVQLRDQNDGHRVNYNGFMDLLEEEEWISPDETDFYCMQESRFILVGVEGFVDFNFDHSYWSSATYNCNQGEHVSFLFPQEVDIPNASCGPEVDSIQNYVRFIKILFESKTAIGDGEQVLVEEEKDDSMGPEEAPNKMINFCYDKHLYEILFENKDSCTGSPKIGDEIEGCVVYKVDTEKEIAYLVLKEDLFGQREDEAFGQSGDYKHRFNCTDHFLTTKFQLSDLQPIMRVVHEKNLVNRTQDIEKFISCGEEKVASQVCEDLNRPIEEAQSRINYFLPSLENFKEAAHEIDSGLFDQSALYWTSDMDITFEAVHPYSIWESLMYGNKFIDRTRVRIYDGTQNEIFAAMSELHHVKPFASFYFGKDKQSQDFVPKDDLRILEEQIFGCMDTVACNFNDQATTDDGSCTYEVFSMSSVTACDSFTWEGQTVTSTQDLKHAYDDSTFCGVHTLRVTINNSSTSSENVTACDSYDWNGATYNASGTYTWSTTNALGCDSTATLNLTINHPLSYCDVCEEGMYLDQDADSDGVCNADEIEGCTEASALNYDAAATDADGSCIVPSSIFCGSSVTGSTVESANNYGGISPEDIYRFEVASMGDYEFSTCGSAYDTYLRIYNENMTEIHSGDDDGDCGTRTILNKPLEPGVYYILIEGYSSYSGSYELTVSCAISGTIGCSPQEVLDCNGNCAPEIWLSDGSCDDGSYKSGGHFIFLNCEAHNNDQGDCETSTESNNSYISINHSVMYSVEVAMQDSYGDGWNGNRYEIFNAWGSTEAQGSLLSGFGGTDYWDLPEGCYRLEVGGGTWQDEVSWHVHVSHPDAGISVIQRETGSAVGEFVLSLGPSDCTIDDVNVLTNWGRMASSIQQEEVVELVDEMDLTASFQARTNLLIIEVENYGNRKLDYQLYDVLGNLLDTDQLTGALTHINMSHLPHAVYMLKVNTTNKETLQTFKVVKH